ncbi:acetyltransferase [Burkholderia sp. ABCPW 14]|uniref:acetyltransferase n=1 Tax=Burkholderia sp. ABCPW 14 TaxID=1637860 RepID=UPI000770C7CF|nr:acetyltransferase [Burkholderia sp. ABCPW 14]KVD82521.1 acetyltransferase [Burkholderia sp. ABCPW 14]
MHENAGGAGRTPPTRIFAFNGDADGLCALQQLRLAEGPGGTLVTGVKRDVRLLDRVSAAAGDEVTVLDVSHDQNRADVERLLAAGARLRYFDHHFAGALPGHPNFHAYIDTAADVCTSAIVDRYLQGRHARWAIVAAFGDALPQLGHALALAHRVEPVALERLAQLGQCLNYNAYGERVADLHFDPAALAETMQPFADPLDFIGSTDVLRVLSDGYRDDLRRARAVRPEVATPHAIMLVLPPESWARRVTGVLANEVVQSHPACALAILSPKTDGGYVVSVRVPVNSTLGADDFCRGFETGGGRKCAAGVNHLPADQLDRFAAHFKTTFDEPIASA